MLIFILTLSLTEKDVASVRTFLRCEPRAGLKLSCRLTLADVIKVNVLFIVDAGYDNKQEA